MTLSQIPLRDPFILAEDGIYYLYGSRGFVAKGLHATGVQVWRSRDLVDWSAPVPVLWKGLGGLLDGQPDEGQYFWAPEVHAALGAYFLFTTFKESAGNRGTRVFRAESPLGPFLPWSDGAVTPADWEALDGTLFFEDGKPFLVFCHEWIQIHNGTMCAIPLTDDLRAAAGEPQLLFAADSAPWNAADGTDFVTDGPWLHRSKSGVLQMLWSTCAETGYCEALYRSESGRLAGPWVPSHLLFSRDGGHGMVFEGFDGIKRLVLHVPNHSPDERPLLLPVQEDAQGLLQSLE